MARIKIHDLTPNASSPAAALTDAELDNVVGGALLLSASSTYFTRPTFMSYRQLPLPGGSLSSSPSPSGVRG